MSTSCPPQQCKLGLKDAERLPPSGHSRSSSVGVSTSLRFFKREKSPETSLSSSASKFPIFRPAMSVARRFFVLIAAFWAAGKGEFFFAAPRLQCPGSYSSLLFFSYELKQLPEQCTVPALLEIQALNDGSTYNEPAFACETRVADANFFATSHKAWLVCQAQIEIHHVTCKIGGYFQRARTPLRRWAMHLGPWQISGTDAPAVKILEFLIIFQIRLEF
jgi:hypothetical protein